MAASLTTEASYELSPRWRLIGDAKYIFRVGELWAQVRPELKYNDELYLGLVSSLSKGPGFSSARAGASFSGFSYAVPWMGDVYIAAEVGLEYNITTKNSGAFGALHVGFAY